MKTLEIRSNSIKVESNEMTFLVARYDDENGTYFFNENLEKQYAVIEEIAQPSQPSQPTDKEYSFMVQYEHKGRERGWDERISTVIAPSYEEALEKVTSNFKTIFEIAEV